MKIELSGHKTTSACEASILPQGRKPVNWVLQDGQGSIVKAKTRFVAKSYSQVQDVGHFPTFARTPSSAKIKIMMAAHNEQGSNIFHLKVAHALICAKLDAET